MRVINSGSVFVDSFSSAIKLTYDIMYESYVYIH